MNDFWFGFCCGALGASVLRAHVQACFDREEELITHKLKPPQPLKPWRQSNGRADPGNSTRFLRT